MCDNASSSPIQRELALAFPAMADVPPLPARMINEFVYCPRLAYLEWVQCEWSDSADTVEGRFVHRRVDRSSDTLPLAGELAEGDEERIHARSVALGSDRLGLVTRIDLIEGEESGVAPVDYKRGKRPHIAREAYAPERVQIGVQVLLLRDNGYACDHGYLYFAASRERVPVPFDAALEEETWAAIQGLRLMAASGHIPPPLEDSPKCPRCSLVGICLPDEVAWMQHGRIEPRPLSVARAEALPLIVQAPYARIGRSGETVRITMEDAPEVVARLPEISEVVLIGSVSVTTPCLHEFMRRGIPVSWHTYGGWFLGHTVGTGHRNVELRTAQYRTSFDEAFCLRLARGLVEAKIINARTFLRRNWRGGEKPEATLAALTRDREAARKATSLDVLLGVEGLAASRYFGDFRRLLAKGGSSRSWEFDFGRRNRRPPTDPVNALLSFCYALLVRTWTVALSAVGLDPYRGFYHQPRYGRPSLALDMMEPFRPLIADSVVVQVINNGEVRPGDFVSAAGAVALGEKGRKAVLAAYERRLGHEITHPVFGYRVSYRRLLEIQARLLGRFLAGEMPDFPQITPR